jgi:hypothetical protein
MSVIAEFLARNYHGKKVHLLKGYCPKCHRNGKKYSLTAPESLDHKISFWNKLFERRVYEYQALHSFRPASGNSVSYFMHPLLDMSDQGALCQDGCYKVCVLCQTLISDPPDLCCESIGGSRTNYPHHSCLTTCSWVCNERGREIRCNVMVPSVPSYLPINGAQCRFHKNGGKGLVSATPSGPNRPSTPVPSAPIRPSTPAPSAPIRPSTPSALMPPPQPHRPQIKEPPPAPSKPPPVPRRLPITGQPTLNDFMARAQVSTAKRALEDAPDGQLVFIPHAKRRGPAPSTPP